MKTIFYTLLAGITICLCGCSSAETSLPGIPQQPVAVEFSVYPAAQRVITRTTDEDAVTDTDLYLFGQDNAFTTHLYTTESHVRLECPPGDHRIYVVANRHADLGELTEVQLIALTFDYRENYADLPMSYAGEITVSPDAGMQTLPDIEVRRRVAKVACTISVASQAADIVLKSVCLYNVPRKGNLFGDTMPPASAAGYTSGGYADIPAGAEARYFAVFYIPGNRQGTVSGITSQHEKNRDNAPQYATFLLIRAMRGGRVLDYRVYLGENNTSDFNILSNTHHTLHVSIVGDNEFDTRVHGYTLTVTDDLGRDACGGYCPIDPQGACYIDIEGNAAGLSFSGEMEVAEGDTECLEFHRMTGSFFDFEVWEPQGESYYEMSYFPQLVTESNDKLCYTVTVTDEYGFSQSYDFEHHFANEIRAYVKYGNVPNGAGSVTVSGALALEKIGTTKNLRAMCSEIGCTLRAVPASGYKFAGWYKESDFKTLVSSAESFSYVPTVFTANLFPKFEPDKRFVRISTSIPDLTFTCDGEYELDYDTDIISAAYGSRCTVSALDMSHVWFDGWYDGWDTSSRQLLCTESSYTFTATEDRTIAPVYLTVNDLGASGTANCYIAPKLHAAYRFNATIRGKGRSTTAIAASRITGGQRAEVIWETGATRGAIISKAESVDGKIRFATGNHYGNALIGLFDGEGRCLWSWHIWVTEYDPSMTAQTYTGGRVFMDRNLGALSSSGSNITSRGLYYQWGRKDPFVYPASGSISTPYPVVYGAEFSYDYTDPIMGYGEMSVEYAIAHPWVFMTGIYIGDDRYEDTPDWLSSQNPNLWGNASSATTLSDVGAKSIYDPCPPGWRVPDRKAFAEAQLRKASAATGYRLLYFSSVAATAVYPSGGYWDVGSFVGNGKNGYVWTNAPAQYQSDTKYYKHYATAFELSSSGIEPLARMPREKAMPIRCVRE